MQKNNYLIAFIIELLLYIRHVFRKANCLTIKLLQNEKVITWTIFVSPISCVCREKDQ